MAKITCTNCGYSFDSDSAENLGNRAGSAVSAADGLIAGSGFGIAGAIAGSIAGYFLSEQFPRCPKCKEIFKPQSHADDNSRNA